MANNKESWDGQLAAVKAQLVGEAEGDSILTPEDESCKNVDENKGVNILTFPEGQHGPDRRGTHSPSRQEAERQFYTNPEEDVADRKAQREQAKQAHESSMRKEDAELKFMELQNAAESSRLKSAKLLNYSLAGAIGALSLGAVVLVVRSLRK